MSQKRAKPGGEFGANGEWYEGGTFISTTDKPKGTVKPYKPRRIEIAPYVWEIAPEGKKSIYRAFVGVLGVIRDGKLIVRCSQQTLDYLGRSMEYAQELAELYNQGHRWIDS